MAASCPVVSIGASARAPTIARAIRRDLRSSPNWKMTSASADSSIARDAFGRRRPAGLIHPHVERLVAAEAEPATLGVELHRGNAEVGQGAGHLGRAVRVEHRVEVAVVGVGQPHAIAICGQRLGGHGERLRVAVDADHLVGAALEEGPRMPTETHGAVHVRAPSLRLEEPHGFVDHHRQVLRHVHVRGRRPD